MHRARKHNLLYRTMVIRLWQFLELDRHTSLFNADRQDLQIYGGACRCRSLETLKRITTWQWFLWRSTHRRYRRPHHTWQRLQWLRCHGGGGGVVAGTGPAVAAAPRRPGWTSVHQPDSWQCQSKSSHTSRVVRQDATQQLFFGYRAPLPTEPTDVAIYSHQLPPSSLIIPPVSYTHLTLPTIYSV